MTAIEITRPGAADVLAPCQRPMPRPAAGEVLVRVAAAGINRPDILQRQGGYPAPPGASDIPGLEIAGDVVLAADDVSWPRPGERVMALVAGGGYAEFCLAPARQCLPVPKSVSAIEAGGIPETFFTVWTNVFERGRLAADETLLVHGGASGIGTTAIQLGKAFGARVLATAGTAEKCRACEALGAERAIDYRLEDFVAATRSATGDAGVDVILDMVGGDYTTRNLSLLKVEGRLVQIAFLKGSRVEIDLNPLMRRRLTLTGSTLRPRSVAEKGQIADQLRARVLPLLERRDVRAVVHEVYPLAQAAAAHAALEADRHVGKIILEVQSSTI
jgi:putative PIG3 family NAD(P)H quinone oxidoreductase